MFYRSLVGVLAAALALGTALSGARAFDESKYPDIEGQWKRGSPVASWDPSKPSGRGQQAPLTPQYQAIFDANMAKQKAGQDFDPKANCEPPGMPRLMMMYSPMEIVIKPNATYFMMESVDPLRRIFTDGRDWPKQIEPSFVGYSIGKWVDEDSDGKYDALLVETRGLKGPRLFDSNGIPFHEDNETIVKERIYLDKANPDVLVNEVTTIDHALTEPWTVKRQYRRERNPMWFEYICSEDNRYVILGGEIYMVSVDGFLMPIQKGQPAPDLKYFKAATK
jgi:hypothetical protein